MKIYRFIKLFIFIVFSALIITFRYQLLEQLHYFIGTLILVFGLESSIVLLIVAKKNAFKSIKLSFAFFEIILGITLLAAVRSFEYVCVMWAVWSILRQSIDINEVLKGEVKGPVAVVLLIQSVVSVVFCVMLILNPTEHHAKTHIYLVVTELLVIGLPPVIDEIIHSIKQKKEPVIDINQN